MIDYAVAMVGTDTELFRQLMDLAYGQKPPLCMRAARVADLSCERHPELIEPYLTDMVRQLPKLKDMAVKRVFLHILIRHSWVEDEEALCLMVDTLLLWVRDDNQAIAVRSYALTILEHIAQVIPELKREIAMVLEEALPFWDSTALQTLGKKTIKRLMTCK